MDWLNIEDVASWIKSPGKAQLSPTGFPMFQTPEVEIKKKSDAGVSGRGNILLAKNVDTVWYVETKSRKTRFEVKDSERFLKIKEDLRTQYPDLYIRGILLTNAPFSDDVASLMEEEDCMLINVTDDHSPINSA